MDAPGPLPAALTDLAHRLSDAGHRTWATGESLFLHLCGERPPAWEMLTTAPLEESLAALPRAVPTRPREGVVSVPTAAGPVDLVSCRLDDPPLGDLLRRDFSVHAVARDPLDGAWLDPAGGRADARAGRLRCPGSARERLAERPERILRAARLAAAGGLEADEELRAAMAARADRLGSDALPLSARRELRRLLEAPRPGAGVALLRATGVEAVLVPGAREDAARLLDAVPAPEGLRLALRLAIWLRGSEPDRVLRRLRAGAPLSRCVERLLACHPLERAAEPRREASVRRLLRRLAPAERGALLALREHELGPQDAEARERLTGLLRACERALAGQRREERRRELALDGGDVMSELGCGPGPRVGRALRALAGFVEADPSRNTPDALREELRRWAAQDPQR